MSLLRKMINIASNGLEIFTPSNPGKVSITDGTNEVDIMQTDGSYGLVTINPAHVSTLNSYEGTIASGGTWTGASEDIRNFGSISVIITSSQDTIFKGFNIEFSTDGVNWVDGDGYTLTANETKTFSFQCAACYYRMYIANGIGGIATVGLQTILKPLSVKFSSHRIGDTISPDDDSELVKAVLTAQRTDNDLFVPVTASNSNNLRVTDAENVLAISKGEVVGSDKVNKWGNAKDFDSGDGKIDVWDGAEDGEPYEAMTYTFSTTDAIDSISSESALDIYELTVEGLDINSNEVTQIKTLQGQTRVALDTPLLRVNRAYNDNGTRFTGHVFVFENDTLTGGVPNTPSLIRAIIHPQDQQTEMAIYTIPAGKTGYMLGGYAATSGAKKTTTYIITLETKELNKVFRTKQKFALSDEGSSFVPFLYHTPEKMLEKTDIKMTAQMTSDSQGSVSAGFSIILVDN